MSNFTVNYFFLFVSAAQQHDGYDLASEKNILS